MATGRRVVVSDNCRQLSPRANINCGRMIMAIGGSVSSSAR